MDRATLPTHSGLPDPGEIQRGGAEGSIAGPSDTVAPPWYSAAMQRIDLILMGLIASIILFVMSVIYFAAYTMGSSRVSIAWLALAFAAAYSTGRLDAMRKAELATA